MPPSPVVPSCVEPARLIRPNLLEVLTWVPDPRSARAIRHPLAVILAVGLAAVLAGARSFTAIGEWAQDAGAQTLAELGVGNGVGPSESTIRRALSQVDGVFLDRVIGA